MGRVELLGPLGTGAPPISLAGGGAWEATMVTILAWLSTGK